jgi:hypothetical protein
VLENNRSGAWLFHCFIPSMQKSTPSTPGNAGRCEKAFKPWPFTKRNAREQDLAAGADSLHARFDPRLIGFGIIKLALEASAQAKDCGPHPRDEGAVRPDSEEKK